MTRYIPSDKLNMIEVTDTPTDKIVALKRKRRALAKPADSAPDWLQQCVLGETGKPLAVLANALAAMRSVMPGIFTYDEMLCVPMLMRSLEDEPGFAPRPVTDVDVGIIQVRLQHLGLKRLGKDIAHQAVDIHAYDNRFHPVRNYLKSLQWDGTARVENLFPTYFGTEATSYAQGIGPMFLTSMVARILKPGCKADYMVVLEGPQGTLKSTACDALGSDWFSDNLPDITAGKDASQHLRGKWLIEVSEMHALGRAEAALLKAFITRTTERYRPSYGRKEAVEPRQCIFIGTTNKETYLRDETGGRRFLADQVRQHRHPRASARPQPTFRRSGGALSRRSKLVAGKRLRARHIMPEQAQRYEADAWEDNIRDYVEAKTRVTVGEVGVHALGFQTARIGTADQRRITAALDQLGWKRQPQSWDGKRYWTKG